MVDAGGEEEGDESDSLPHAKITREVVKVKLTETLDRNERLQRLRESNARRDKDTRCRILDELCE